MGSNTNSRMSPSDALTVEGSKVLSDVAVILMVLALARYANAMAETKLLREGIVDANYKFDGSRQ